MVVFLTVNILRKLRIPVINSSQWNIRGGSRAAATSKMERFVVMVNGWKALTITKKRSTLDVAAALDPPLNMSLVSIFSVNWRTVLHPPWSAFFFWRGRGGGREGVTQKYELRISFSNVVRQITHAFALAIKIVKYWCSAGLPLKKGGIWLLF